MAGALREMSQALQGQSKLRLARVAFVWGLLVTIAICWLGFIMGSHLYSEKVALNFKASEEAKPPSVAGLSEQALRVAADKQFVADMELQYHRNLARRDKYYPTLPETVRDALYYYTPHYTCKIERVGRWWDGGKWMCDPKRFDNSTVVYSVGSDGEVSFEEDLSTLCNGCQIHTFDMTLEGRKLANVLKAQESGILTFHNYGLGFKDDPIRNLKNLQAIMESLDHKHIDYFKIDCESCEWDFFQHLFDNWTPGLMKQITIELHHYDNLPRTHKLLKKFEELGYRIFAYELNYKFPLSLIEVSLVHQSFIQDVLES